MSRNTRGLTLIELLGVLFILATVVGILFPTIGRVRQKAKIVKAQAQIEALSVALRMYQSELGVYPPGTDSDPAALHDFLGKRRLSAALNIEVGPFMEFKQRDINAAREYLDPWDAPFVYASKDSTPAAANNIHSFDLHSTGPDGPLGNTDDDVTNW